MISNSDFLGTQNVHKTLFTLSWPAVIAMVASGAYGVIGTLLIAKGIDMTAVGAIGIVFPLHLLYHGFSQMISIGAASAISRSLGQQDSERASLTMNNAYILTTFISLVLMIATFSLTKPLLTICGANSELFDMSQQYLKALIWTIPFNAINLLSSAVFRAEGNIKKSMNIVLIESLLNMALDFVFIFWLGFGIKGIAWATVISQFAGTVYALTFILRKKNIVSFRKDHLKPRWNVSKDILTVGFSAFARNASSTAFNLLTNVTLRTFGGTASLIAFSTVNRIVGIFFLPIMGINQGMQPLASYNFGADKFDRIKQALKFALIYTTLIGVIATLVGLIFPQATIQLFTKKADLLEEATLIFRLQLLFFWTVGFQTITATLYQALGKALPALFISVFKQLLFLIPLVYFLPRFTSLEVLGVWYAFPIAEALAFLVTLVVLWKKYRYLSNKTKGSIA